MVYKLYSDRSGDDCMVLTSNTHSLCRSFSDLVLSVSLRVIFVIPKVIPIVTTHITAPIFGIFTLLRAVLVRVRISLLVAVCVPDALKF